MTPRPFRIDIQEARLAQIRKRLADAQWPDIPEGTPWTYGCSAPELRALVDYWLTRYDWRAEESKLNRFPQFLARVDDYDLHFIHVKGAGPNPKPILITHGWPGSFVEFMKVIEPLTNPPDPADAFSVVVPSLPGFGFSSKPKKPIGPRAMARLFDRLMRETLGYPKYIAQGGDWGAAVSSWLGYEGEGCAAAHVNLLIAWTPSDLQPTTPEEIEAAQKLGALWQAEGGYIAIQGTKPLTLSYAMEDSPLGAAAWIFEKWKSWSQIEGDNIWSVYTRDEVLTNIMVYLVTRSFGTASWIYRGVYDEPVPAGAKVTKPVGVANFPGEGILLPRAHAEKKYNVVRWSNLAKGGHFAAMEQPSLFVDEVRAFARDVAHVL